MNGVANNIFRGLKIMAMVAAVVLVFALNQLVNDRYNIGYSKTNLSSMKALVYGTKFPSFLFSTAQGRRFSNQEFVGGWSLLLVSRNPADDETHKKLELIRQAESQIRQYLRLPDPKLYMISNSNIADHQKGMIGHRDYARHLVRGYVTEDQFHALQFGIRAQDADLKQGVITLIDPKGNLRAVFDKALMPRVLVRDYIAIVHSSSRHG